MEKNYGKNEILKFLYGEFKPEEEKEFIEALYSNESLFEEFELLKEAKESIVIPDFEPSSNSINKIMEAARSPMTASELWAQRKAGKKMKTFLHVYAGSAMLFFGLLTISFSWYTFDNAGNPPHHTETENLDWPGTHIRERLDFVRMNLDNMSGKRELPSPVHNKTYRVVNTANFGPPEIGNVILVNLK